MCGTCVVFLQTTWMSIGCAAGAFAVFCAGGFLGGCLSLSPVAPPAASSETAALLSMSTGGWLASVNRARAWTWSGESKTTRLPRAIA